MIRKKIAIISILFLSGLFATGCGGPSKGKEIPNTLIPLKTEIVFPTETPNPTVTQLPTEIQIADALDVNNYQIVYGYIQEKRGGIWQDIVVPYKAGYIAYVEVHDGKMYAINTAGIAVDVRNDSGKWVKFERPIFGIDPNEYVYENGYGKQTIEFDPNSFDFTEVPIYQIRRLTQSDGSLLPWGLVEESYEWDGVSPFEGYPYISGYYLGEIPIKMTFKANATGKTMLAYGTPFVFEIPNKYFRQIVFSNGIWDQPGGINKLIVHFGDVYPDGDDPVIMGLSEITALIETNMSSLRGSQTVIGWSFESHDLADQELMRSLTSDQGLPHPYISGAGHFWFGSFLRPKDR